MLSKLPFLTHRSLWSTMIGVLVYFAIDVAAAYKPSRSSAPAFQIDGAAPEASNSTTIETASLMYVIYDGNLIFLTSLAFGLFVVIGFIMSQFSNEESRSVTALLSIAAALLFNLTGLVFSYFSRAELAVSVGKMNIDFKIVEELIALQAGCIHISVAFMIVFFSRSVLFGNPRT